jgi:protein-L-isoaspartate O-methyltransferase
MTSWLLLAAAGGAGVGYIVAICVTLAREDVAFDDDEELCDRCNQLRSVRRQGGN